MAMGSRLAPAFSAPLDFHSIFAINSRDAISSSGGSRGMTDLTYRLDDFGRRLEALEFELAELRALAHPEPEPFPTQPAAEVQEPPARRPSPKAPAARPQPLPTRHARPRREIDWSVLFGAKALAWAGGAVTLLGVVFFFVLAVNRGW